MKTRLTPKERRELRQMMMDLVPVRVAAARLGVSHATIYTELSLGMTEDEYKERMFTKYNPAKAEEVLFRDLLKEMSASPDYKDLADKIEKELAHVSGVTD